MVLNRTAYLIGCFVVILVAAVGSVLVLTLNTSGSADNDALQLRGEKGEQGERGMQGVPGEKGEQGDKGLPGDTPTISINAGGYWVINGETTQVRAVGATGPAGRNVESIEKTGTSEDGLTDTYTITYSDETTETFTITNGTNGTNGAPGADGKEVSSVDYESSDDLVDTYKITYNDDTYDYFYVTNGKDGKDGKDGDDGESITVESIIKKSTV
ncbi:MAG: collagen-like protein, partial [Christensenellaceae bacterium]|nr:collagen-like protein [Christensenellaceae bacterium]